MTQPTAKALLTDEALASQVCDGDMAAFAVLTERHGAPLAAFAGKVLLDQALGEDVVQDAFLKFWQKPDLYDPVKARFSTWMHKVVLNRCLDLRRRKPLLGLDSATGISDPAMPVPLVLEEGERDQAVRRAINTLPERQRAALLLCHMEGHSNRDAAVILNVKLKALESLLSRARANLRAALAPIKEELL